MKYRALLNGEKQKTKDMTQFAVVPLRLRPDKLC